MRPMPYLVALPLIACAPAVQTPALTQGGAVAAATPEAAAAGREILEAGGNAVDAAVAVAFVLGVTEPAGSGLGGQTSFLVHPRGAAPFAITGTSFSPACTPPDARAEDVVRRRLTTVPSTVRVLEFAWREYGSGRITWAQVLAPAIRYAEEGFPLGGFRHRALARDAAALREDAAAAGFYLNPDGSVPAVGDTVRQPVLARTLRRLAEAGADDFYRGEIARTIAADLAPHGWVTLADLARVPAPRVLPALHGTYRGWDVYTLPPPAGGWAVLQVLNVLEEAPPDALAAGRPERLVWLAEALRIGHRSRRVDPVRNLEEYEGETAVKTGKARARELMQSFERPGGGETTHFSVVDGQGMGVAVTQSLNSYFGARIANPTLGFLYNDYMREFEVGRPDHPHALRPGAMPYSSMSATVVSRHGVVVLVLGSPGSSRIISAVVQVIHRWVDLGESVAAAVAAPRIHVVPDRDLLFESGLPADDLHAELERRGFAPQHRRTDLAGEVLDPYFGGVHAVAWEGGVWRGAADPRRDGVALAQRAPAAPVAPVRD